MTMHTVFFKEHEGIHAENPINGAPPPSAVPRWSGLGGSQPPPAVAYGENLIQSKLASLELSAVGNGQFSVAKEDQQALGKGNITHFTLFSDYDIGECKSAENGDKTPLQSTVSSLQAAPMDYRGHFDLGFGQPLICAKYPYPDQCYGVYSTYGTQFAGRIMLPLSISTESGPIFVNAKQYNGIMRRRKKRAEAEMENKVLKIRKPYLHLSRHLHAMRRPRGNGGRFLNTRSTTSPKMSGEEKQVGTHTGGSKIFEMLQPDGGGINSKGRSDSSRSTSPGSEITRDHALFSRATAVAHPFQLNHLHSSFQHVGNTGIGIAMVSGNNYLKV
uniref:Nuclear transcription factor Y subunit n=1 Tax=Tectona grandis TaxID=41396 RepID=A0A2Z4K5F5_TECGR|nr:NF-Y2 protein [Tectona grandis]